MNYLSRLEELLLLTILRLKDNAYAVPIIQDIKSKTGISLSPGALWVSLDSLTKKGYLKKTHAESTPEIGGRGKIYYDVTDKGIEGLQNVKKMQEIIWEDLHNVTTRKSQ